MDPSSPSFQQIAQQPRAQENEKSEKSGRKSEKEDELKQKHEDEALERLEKKLEEFQENARFIGELASNFQTKYQDTLNGRIFTLVRGLQDLDRLKGEFSGKHVPLDLLPYLDDGKNPLLYSKHCMEKTIEKNKSVNGKIEIYKKFRAHLLRELGEEMPDLVIEYTNLRAKELL